MRSTGLPRQKTDQPRVSDARIRRTLHQRFGLQRFRPGQEHVIRNVLAGIDTLAIMPTGSGKSLCYQLPALLLPGTTVVVSPLIALMNDQADKLNGAGVDTEAVNSALNRGDEARALDRIANSRSEIVLVTPERLANPEFLAQLAGNRIDVFVVDEAHCISQWGHDFRPAFLELANALETLGDPPVLALTATASNRVAADIRAQLRRPRMQIVNASAYRPNLQYEVRQATSEDDKFSALQRTLTRVLGACIVYTATVKAAQELSERLHGNGREVLLYHGRLGHAAREQNQQRFMASAHAVMVATNAFGLGIDKPDVRAVVHWQMPASLEAYYQESGRAGRDGQPALCQLLYQHSDKRIQAFFLAGRYPGADDVETTWRRLAAHTEPVSALDLAAEEGNLPAAKVRVSLKALCDAGLVHAVRGRYQVGARPENGDTPHRVAEAYRARAEQDRIKLETLIAYAQTARCRWLTLLEYFAEQPGWTTCGVCDNCVHPKRVPAMKANSTATVIAEPKPFDLGQRVRVPRYGAGTVAAVSAQSVTIAFSDGSARPFLRSYVQAITEGD